MYNYQNYFIPCIVSARYDSKSRYVVSSQTYNEIPYLKMRLEMRKISAPLSREDYTLIRDFYWQLSDLLYTPEISFVKNYSHSLSVFRIRHRKGNLFIYELDALFLVERNFDFDSPAANAIIMSRFLRFIRDGLELLEKYYGSLPF
jgi:hypothetical protein